MPSNDDSAKPVVIHVPKTGGTTLIMAITRGKMQPKADEHYRHVLWNEDRTITHSNCGDLFEPDGAERYAGRKVMLTLRTPIDRLESEYHFLGNREEYRTLWTRHNQTTFPPTFAEFVRCGAAGPCIGLGITSGSVGPLALSMVAPTCSCWPRIVVINNPYS